MFRPSSVNLLSSFSTKFLRSFCSSLERERTFIAIKPEALQRGLVGTLITRFEQRGYKMTAIKMVQPPEAKLAQHYREAVGKPYYPNLISQMTAGPFIVMVWEGLDIIKNSRSLIGETEPKNSMAGTIRADLAIHKRRNLVHGSDTVENAKREIELWFGKEEIFQWDQALEKWIIEKL